MAENDRTPSQVALLECNLDDMTGEELGYVLERALAEGALEAWFTPVYMKKNRPGVILSVLCHPTDAARFAEFLLRETSTLGVRHCLMERTIAERTVFRVATPWGEVRCKAKRLGGEIVSIKPEYEDCARIAREQSIPLERVMLEVRLRAQAH